jgi:quinol monooxygenase YgiN
MDDRYGRFGSLKTRPGCRDDVIGILLSGVDGLRNAGCDLYVVATEPSDDVTIWVTEVWRTKKHHADSLQMPETKAAIAAAMPMLTGEFTSRALAVVGGLGV